MVFIKMQREVAVNSRIKAIIHYMQCIMVQGCVWYVYIVCVRVYLTPSYLPSLPGLGV